MGKFLKPGKIVIVLKGRYAGRKAVIVKSNEEGTKNRPFPHAIVAGINVYPRKVTRAHSKKKVAQRSRVKCFVKHFNFTHLMPTRTIVSLTLMRCHTSFCCLRTKYFSLECNGWMMFGGIMYMVQDDVNRRFNKEGCDRELQSRTVEIYSTARTSWQAP
eukprot:Phypoly_transcript_24541.p1 GENE.Phypoly_transcript_24541~~Phypoly_transcript_24541.p1  ORF type:complete len:159 (+),score=10.87 Phypoly_transcript_24541:32-508(+)